MDLTQLRTFVAVAQEGHLTRAAERLHISQPTASAHIRALEDRFNLQLFSRTPRGLELTTAGRQLAESAASVLAATSGLDNLARKLSGHTTGRVAIGAVADPAFGRLGPLLNLLRQRHPLLEVSIEVCSSLVTEQSVRTGELHCGFMAAARLPDGLQGLTLRTVQYRIAAPRSWAETVRRADWKALAALPWVVLTPGTANQEMREALFRPQGLQVNATVEVNNAAFVRNLVADGVGMGLVRSDFAEEGERQGLYALSDLGIGETLLMFVYPRGNADDPALQAIIDAVRATWCDELGDAPRDGREGPPQGA